MIGFEQYSRIKNNYCLCYFGYSDEYLVQLRLLKPVFEQCFPGLNLCLGCKDDKTHILRDVGHVLTISKIKVDRKSYAYIREVRFNGKTHPVEDLLVESKIKSVELSITQQPRANNRCVIITHGAHPTKPLAPQEIQRFKESVADQGYEFEIDTDPSGASLVMGVESVGLFEAAAQGISTKLVPTGFGTRLYRYMFPKGEVFR